MRLRSLAALAVLAMAFSLVPAGAATKTIYKTRKVAEDYVGSFDPLGFGRCKAAPVSVNIGLVCIPLRTSDKYVKLVVADQALGNPGFFYSFMDATGACVGASSDQTADCKNDGSGCGSAKRLAVPKGAVRLEIFPAGFALGPIYCNVDTAGDSPGPAVAGTITTTITYAVKVKY